jgi:hypothetical protein
MADLENIKQSIVALSHSDVWKLAEWLDEYKNDRWDQQIAEDVEAGRLDKLFERAQADIRAGRMKPL